MTLTTETVLVRAKDQPAADLDIGTVVLCLQAGVYFSFNRVATEIWHMLAQPCPIAKIFSTLAERHAVDLDTLDRDVTPFLQILIEHRLAQVLDAGSVR